MKSLVLFAALAAAAPLANNNNKRNVVWSTVTDVVVETLYTTTTVWVDPSTTASVPGGFFETYPTGLSNPGSGSSSSSSSSSTTSLTSTSAAAPPPPPPTAAPSPVINNPVVPAVQPQAPAPPAPPAPSSPATPPTTSTPPTAPSGTQPAAAGDHTGDITYYDVSVGLGSCGWQGTNAQNLVALSSDDMKNGANPNNNPLCGKTINIVYQGVSHSATVYDTCPTCAQGSIDLTQTLFNLVAPNGDGRVHGVTWSFA